MELERSLVDVDYNPDPWEIEESPESVVSKVEAAKQANRKFVELVEDEKTGRRIWLSIANITAVYLPEGDTDEEDGNR